jgi:hypothetical protein
MNIKIFLSVLDNAESRASVFPLLTGFVSLTFRPKKYKMPKHYARIGKYKTIGTCIIHVMKIAVLPLEILIIPI